MKRWLLAILALGCAPGSVEVESGCDSVADCPLKEVCGPMGRCIAEPADRFLGAFTCQARFEDDSVDELELSEVIGRIAGYRWALPSVYVCELDPDDDHFLLNFGSSTSGAVLSISLTASGLSDRVGSLGPYFDLGKDAAALVDLNAHQVLGYSETGRVELSETPTPGDLLEGYLDVSMLATQRSAETAALFGVPCPRGMADCGYVWGDVGGAELCTEFLYGPMCSRFCDANSDCALGDGVCLHVSDDLPSGYCTLPCVSDGDCPSPLVCFPGDPGEGSGCF